MESNTRLDRQNKRRRQILGATLRLLRRHGTGISTAQIAAEANCSKETLYNWFDDRDGIFKALAEEQAASMGRALQRLFAASEGGFREKLQAYCLALLDMTTGEAVIAVNRTAMAQACHENVELGEVVLRDWREHVVQPFLELFDDGVKSGVVKLDDPRDAFDVLLGLLIGDQQRHLLLGGGTRPKIAAMETRSATAVEHWVSLFRV